MFRLCLECLEQTVMIPELGLIAALEPLPLFRVMSEPFPKLGAWRDFLKPQIDPSFFF